MASKIPKLADHQVISAGTVASIEELLTEILIRLPIRKLLQFQSVSKLWKSLIRSPEFLKMRSPNPDPATGLFMLLAYPFSARQSFNYVSFDGVSTMPPMRISTNNLQSCNGLLLCSTILRSSTKRTSTYCVYNPTTNESFILPELYGKKELRNLDIRSISLAFDPNISPFYKVICVRRSSSKGVYYNYIYSSETGVWTSCPEQSSNLSVNCFSGVYWNGGVFWFNAESYFSIEDQIVKRMPMPPIGGLKQNYYFGESCGHLYYTKMRTPKYCPEIHVYELKSDYSAWIMKHVVDCNHFPGHIQTVRCVVHGDKEEDSFMVLQLQGKVVRYNIVSKALVQLHEFPPVTLTSPYNYKSVDMG